jgi:curved DNA-binding protein CbpA
VPQNSSDKTIRYAFLGLAKKFHPDFNPTGKQKFLLIQEAYQVLSDARRRKEYDEFYEVHINPESVLRNPGARRASYGYQPHPNKYTNPYGRPQRSSDERPFVFEESHTEFTAKTNNLKSMRELWRKQYA